MSNRALHWALEQEGLKPGPWIVLIKLADRHNKDTLRTDPNQARLVEDCNMARSTVNAHIEHLESSGLLVRVPRQDPVSKKQMSTFYILGIDFKNPPDVEYAMSDYRTRIEQVQNGNIAPGRVRNSDADAVSGKQPIPCPKNSQSRVRNSDTNLGIEPVREPCAGGADDFDFDVFLDIFVSTYPRIKSLSSTRTALEGCIASGALPSRILEAARGYAEEQKGNPKRFVAFAETWLEERRYEDHPERAKAQDPALIRAEAIKKKLPWVAAHTSAAAARDLIHRKLVSEDECQAAGILV